MRKIIEKLEEQDNVNISIATLINQITSRLGTYTCMEEVRSFAGELYNNKLKVIAAIRNKKKPME
jgi:hypothetical protein